MTAHRPAAVTWPALLLLLLAACMPASPVAPALTATLVAPAPRPATLTPTLAPTLVPTPTPFPRPQLSLLDDSLFSPAEQATLQSLISAVPADWGLTPDMDLQPDRGNGNIYLVAINRTDQQPANLIIVLEAITATKPLAIVKLAGARSMAQSMGVKTEVSAIMVTLLPPYEGQIVGVDKDGNVILTYDIASGQWRSAAPPTPEPTSTPDAAEALRQTPWEVRYATGINGELTAQYYNTKTQEVVSVQVPEVDGLKTITWQAPNGENRAIYLDPNNQYGLAQHTEKFANTTVNYPIGYAGEFEPKIKVEMPSGEIQRGAVVLLPEVTRKLTAEFRAKLLPGQLERGFWGMPFPLDTRATTGRDGELQIAKNPTFRSVDVYSGVKESDKVIIPIEDKGVEYTDGYGGEVAARIIGMNLEKAGLTPIGGWQLLLTVDLGSTINPGIVDSHKLKSYPLGFLAAFDIETKIDFPENQGPNPDSYLSIKVFNGADWPGFSLTNTFLRTASGSLVCQATTIN